MKTRASLSIIDIAPAAGTPSNRRWPYVLPNGDVFVAAPEG